MSISNNTPISFVGYRIKNLSYSHNKPSQEDNLKIVGGVGTSDDLKKGIVSLKVSVFNKANDALIKIEMIGSFKNNNNLPKEKFEEFLSVNGSAMLYPYVRSICSVLSSLDSSDSTVLPSLNFSDAYKKYQQHKDN